MSDFVDAAHAKRLKFRALLNRTEMTVMPGGFSPLLAAMAERVGFEAYFVAGSQMSSWLFAVPDTGVLSLRDIVDHARHVAAHTTIPILLDADTGFGNAANVWFSVEEIVRSGVAGLQIEDQEAPKKSGTGGGRRCISIDEAVGKYRAAVAARDTLDPAFVVCARTDSVGSEGGGIDDAIRRCQAYLKDGGVDLVWLNAVETMEDVKRAAKEIPGPLLVTGGAAKSLEEYAAAGVKIYLSPAIAAQAALQGAWQTLSGFKQGGIAALAEWGAKNRAHPAGPIDFRTLTRNAMVKELEANYMPADKQRDYEHTFGIDTPKKD